MSLYEELLSLAKSRDLIHKTTNLDVLKEETDRALDRFSIEAHDIDFSDEDEEYDFCKYVTQDLLSLWFPNITNIIERGYYDWSCVYNLDSDVHSIVRDYYYSKN